MSVCTSCCHPRLPRACVSLSSLVILLSSNNPASIPKIPIKRCPPPSLPNIDLLHHHAASIIPGLFSLREDRITSGGRASAYASVHSSAGPLQLLSASRPCPLPASSVPPSWPSCPQDLGLPKLRFRECFLAIFQAQTLFTF